MSKKGFRGISGRKKVHARKWVIRRLKDKDVFEYEGRAVGSLKNIQLDVLFMQYYGMTVKDGYALRSPLSVKRKKKRYPDRLEGHKGYVYIIGNLERGMIKIGYSVKPNSRLGSIQTGCPFEIEIISIFSGTRRTEKRLHHKYSEYRMKGEWFEVRGRLLKAINRIKSPMKIVA